MGVSFLISAQEETHIKDYLNKAFTQFTFWTTPVCWKTLWFLFLIGEQDMLCKIVRSQNNFQWFRKKFGALEFVSENSRHPQPISFQT